MAASISIGIVVIIIFGICFLELLLVGILLRKNNKNSRFRLGNSKVSTLLF
jgi:hypothetical protein